MKDPRTILGKDGWRLTETEMENAWAAAKIVWAAEGCKPGTESYYALVRVIEDKLQETTTMEEQNPVTHIVPSVGRVVWYWPALDGTDDLDWSDTRQPCRADICHVNHDDTLNLSVNDHFGTPRARRGITLHQGDAENCSLPRPFATWMPYQKATAAKERSLGRAGTLGGATLQHQDRMAHLQEELLAEQVRELRLKNDAQEMVNRHLSKPLPGMPTMHKDA